MPFDSLVQFALVLSLGFYVASVTGLLVGLSLLRSRATTAKPSVSVVVAARNEEKHIAGLLENLVRQQYSDYEIIIVDDRSSDDTANIVKAFQRRHGNIRLIQITALSAELPPKKNALTQGILASKGTILCFTDADCLPPPGWIGMLVSLFDENVGLVAGYSPYDHSLFGKTSNGIWKSLLYQFIRFEELKGTLWSAGAIGLGRGWLCTGRNLAYKRSVWDEVGGFEDISHSISGDDDLFLQLIRKKTKHAIRYASRAESHVPTAPPSSFSDFLQQRKRHFSAGKFFSIPMKLFFLLFHASNLFLLCGLFAGLILMDSLAVGVWFFVGKLLIDAVLLMRGTSLLSISFSLGFILMEFPYILYNTFIGPLGFLGTFKWKPEPKS